MRYHYRDRDDQPTTRSNTNVLAELSSTVRRDVTKFDYAYQLQALNKNANRLTRRMRKAAIAGDTARMQHLAKMLVDTQGKAMVIMDKIERLK